MVSSFGRLVAVTLQNSRLLQASRSAHAAALTAQPARRASVLEGADELFPAQKARRGPVDVTPSVHTVQAHRLFTRVCASQARRGSVDSNITIGASRPSCANLSSSLLPGATSTGAGTLDALLGDRDVSTAGGGAVTPGSSFTRHHG